MREAGINSARLLLPRCYFDAGKCSHGIEALKQYRTQYDEKHDVLRGTPVHDWASHAADAFRYLSVALERHVNKSSFNRKIVYPKLGQNMTEKLIPIALILVIIAFAKYLGLADLALALLANH